MASWSKPRSVKDLLLREGCQGGELTCCCSRSNASVASSSWPSTSILTESNAGPPRPPGADCLTTLDSALISASHSSTNALRRRSSSGVTPKRSGPLRSTTATLCLTSSTSCRSPSIASEIRSCAESISLDVRREDEPPAPDALDAALLATSCLYDSLNERADANELLRSDAKSW